MERCHEPIHRRLPLSDAALLERPEAVYLERPDGSRVRVAVDVEATQAGDGCVWVVREPAPVAELAELRQRNEALERLVALRTRELREVTREWDTFAYTVAHDLRAPLRAMHGFGQILLEGPGLDPSGRALVARIAEAGKRMDTLIHDLLAYSEISRRGMTLGTVDLATLVHDVLRQLAERIELCRATVVVEGALPIVHGHASSLSLALTHLIGNALTFVSPGDTPHVTVGVTLGDGLVRVWVEDRGIGIAREHGARLFQLFQRLHTREQYPGTGIGLASVRRVLERMGGQAGFASEPGRGSRFWIELPEQDGAVGRSSPGTPGEDE